MRSWRAEVVRRLAHPGQGFTQGLITDGATVWESTGLYGQSALCRYPLGTAPRRTAILQPPKPEIPPSSWVMERVANRDLDLEASE